MGCGHTKASRADSARNRQIDRQLKRDYSMNDRIVKLLLLGTGESGKSTIVKQMKLLHPVNNRTEIGFSDQEKYEARMAIYANILESMVSLLEAMDLLGFSLENSDLLKDRAIVHKFFRNIERRPSRISQTAGVMVEELVFQKRPDEDVIWAIERLWNSQGIQNTYFRRSEFQLCDNAGYFLSAVSRVCQDNYVPTDQDILRTRITTTGIVKIAFEYKDTIFNMYDVGGQRSERKKWIHCFDNVRAVLFIVALSEYDQTLVEDCTVNRMHESLNLFSSLVNNEHFRKKPFIVFFNKSDLFREKIQHKSISIAFPDYDGPQNYESCSKFIISRFLSLNKTDSYDRQIYTYLTTATDTELVQVVFSTVAEIFLDDLFKSIGLH